jgi:hypothetical protein
MAYPRTAPKPGRAAQAAPHAQRTSRGHAAAAGPNHPNRRLKRACADCRIGLRQVAQDARLAGPAPERFAGATPAADPDMYVWTVATVLRSSVTHVLGISDDDR